MILDIFIDEEEKEVIVLYEESVKIEKDFFIIRIFSKKEVIPFYRLKKTEEEFSYTA